MIRAPVSKFSGFTLVEVMMAATILVVGLVGMMQAVTIGSEMLDTGRKQTVAAQIIQDQIERVRLMSWTDVAAIAETPAPVALPVGFTVGGSAFECVRSASNVKADLRRLTFTVTWQ